MTQYLSFASALSLTLVRSFCFLRFLCFVFFVCSFVCSFASLRRPFVVLTVGMWLRTDGGHRDPTFGQIAWQAFTALAHGAKGILYFVGWPDPDPKIFGYGDALFVRDVPPSVKGRTAASIPVGDIHPGHHMADAAKVNAIVLAFAQYLLKASSTAVYHLPSAHAADGGSHSAALSGSVLLDDLTGGCDCAGSPGGQGCERLMAAFEHCGHYLVGEFKLADGRPALMIQNQDPSGAQWPTVVLHMGLSYAMVLEVDPEHGTLAPVLDSSALLPGLQLRIAPGMARLFVIDRSAAAATHRPLKTDDQPAAVAHFVNGSTVVPVKGGTLVKKADSVGTHGYWIRGKTDDSVDAQPAAHQFWGMSGGDSFLGIDVVPNPNNCTKCFVAGNFVRSVGVMLGGAQPNCNYPHPHGGCTTCKPPVKPTPGWRGPPTVPGSKAMNHTIAALMNPLFGGGPGRRTLTFDGGE